MRKGSRGRVVVAASFIGCLTVLCGTPAAVTADTPPLPVPLPVPTPTATPAQPLPSPSAPSLGPGAPTPPSQPLAPPAPLQPGSPASPPAACTWSPLQGNEVRTVYDHAFTGSEWWWSGASLVVDPTNPCVMYTTANTMSSDNGGYPATVFRSTLTPQGTGWNPVFTTPSPPEDSALPPDSATTCSSARGGSGISSGSIQGCQTQPMAAVGPTGTVWLAPISHGTVDLTRVYRSVDSGSHWDERDNGFLVQTPNTAGARVVPAQSDPQTAYVVTSMYVQGHGNGSWRTAGGDGPALLHVTADAGNTWSTRPLPQVTGDEELAGPEAFMVDPTDATSLYYLAPTANNGVYRVPPTYPVTWHSQDGGRTWVPTPTTAMLPMGWFVDESFVTHPAGRSSRLYAHVEQLEGGVTGAQSMGNGAWFESLDQGATWHALPLPQDHAGWAWLTDGTCWRPCFTDYYGVPDSFLAPDPTNPDLLVWSDGGSHSAEDHTLRLMVTSDDFRGGPIRSFGLTVPQKDGVTAEALQTDANGDFFLAIELGGIGWVRDYPYPHNPYTDPALWSSPAGSHRATVLAFRPSALSGSFAVKPLPPAVAPIHHVGDFSTYYQDVPQVPEVQGCSLTAGPGGTLAFDGRYLDFAQGSAAPGVIYRGDGASCAQAPSLVLRGTDFPGGVAPVIQALTYDSLYRWPGGRQGAILATAPPGSDSRLQSYQVPIYAVDPVSGASVLFTGVNATSARPTTQGACGYDANVGTGAGPGVNAGNACGVASFFSFDEFRQEIYSYGTPPGGGGVNDPHPGVLHLDGSFGDNCFSTFYHQDSAGNQADWAALIGAAVVGGDGYLYVSMEDDRTVWKVDTRTCDTVGGFSHADLGENQNEEEQIACDPLTLGSPVIWVRNSNVTVDPTTGRTTTGVNEVGAYSAADAYCPFPTRLTYNGPTIVKPGAPVELCFTLDAALAGQWQSLNGQPINVQIGGADAGRVVTDPSGRACLASNAPVAPGSVSVQGQFPGTNAYLPSTAGGSLLVLPTGAGLTIPGLFLPETPAGPPPPEPASGPQPNPAPGNEPVPSSATQMEAQMQAQSQAQSQTQSVAQAQPGLVVQRRRQEQVAVQQQQAAQAEYQAVGVRRATPAPLAAIAAGMMMFMLGVGWVARRPRWALARIDRGARRR